jgi:anti-sigma B factor antagonist
VSVAVLPFPPIDDPAAGEEPLTVRPLSANALAVGGELDLLTGPRLALATEGWPGLGDRLYLDLTGLAFVDCRGLTALLTLRARLERDGGRLVLRNPRANVRRFLVATGVDDLVPADRPATAARRRTGRPPAHHAPAAGRPAP